MSYINKIICGDNLTVLKTLPSESVNCCVTSPPYWGLRNYDIKPVIWNTSYEGPDIPDCKHKWIENIKIKNTIMGFQERLLKEKNKNTKLTKKNNKLYIKSDFCQICGAWRGSLGLEPTFELYIKHLCDIFNEIKRVLKKDGTCWVNLGDSYASGGGASRHFGYQDPKYKNGRCGNYIEPSAFKQSVLPKSLCLIPQRFVIEMVNRGWILRNTIIWHKPNCMPSPIKDRFTVDFEYVYFFVKSKKYWFEQQFEKNKDTWGERWGKYTNPKSKQNKYHSMSGAKEMSKKEFEEKYSLNGRNKRAIWTIPTKPFPEAHFAVYPEALIEPMIKAGCPKYVCKKCGKARVKIYKHEKMNIRSHKLLKGKVKDAVDGKNKDYNVGGGFSRTGIQFEWNHIPVGYTDCGCNAGFEGGIVLDPFIGAGTTAIVAKKQSKGYVGIEIKQEYIDMANKRIKKIPELLPF